jgi:hypothetical protein
MQLVPTAIRQAVGRQTLLAHKSAPKVLFATGVAGMIGSTVLACRATLEMEGLIQHTKINVDMAKNLREQSENGTIKHSTKPVDGGVEYTQESIVYSEAQYNHDVRVLYSRAVVNTAKLYGPAIILGAASISCLAKSHDMLVKRNAALTAAYVAVDEAFNQYRARVVEKYGEEQDREFRHGVVEVDMVDENGKLYTEKQPGDLPSMYARFFDEYSTSWSKQPDYNYVFLHCQQKYANDMLKARGHLFLNEVYDLLGIDRTKAGSVVGWVISHEGDNYVDFGIFKDARNSNEVRDFINGRNGSVLLDFNVDGVIYDQIDSNGERLKWQS